MSLRFLPLACPMVFLAIGCAPSGEFPSLKPRAIERQLAGVDPEPVPTLIPDDPRLAAKAEVLVARARLTQAGFEAALASAAGAVSRAGAAGGDAWIAAQQAISRAEAARAPAVTALSELDALAADQANGERPISAADTEKLLAAIAAAEAIAASQAGRIERLRAALRPI